MKIIYKLATRAFEDKYLHKLIYKLEKNFSNRFIDKNCDIDLLDVEIDHLLRFADILCRSKDGKHRNLSLKIISLLFELKEIKDSTNFKIIATNTLVKLGNFPTISIIEDSERYLKLEEIRNDYIIKTLAQESPLGGPFTDGQYSVFEEMKKRNHFSFSGSTSFGKSYIFETFTQFLIKEHNKTDSIAFIVPTKALINQVASRLHRIAEQFEYSIITSPVIPKVLISKENRYIFVLTAERLVSYFMNSENPKIDYLFVDEAHKLLSYKDVRTPLLYHSLILAKRKSVKIYFASPNIPNADIFLKLINNSTEESMAIVESPVTQNRFFIDTMLDNSIMISDFGEDIVLPKFNFGKIAVENLKIILDIFSIERQSIIYCNTVDKTIKTALDFSELLTDIKSDIVEEVISLIDEKVHHQYYLIKCLKKGIAYHFGGIPEEIKIYIEKLYKDGKIKYLFCTSTLLEGVNLPAKNIFILSEKIGNGNMNNIDFWNLAGRAGRLSKDISGNIFCVNLYNQKGYWKDLDSIELLRNKKIVEVEPQIISKQNENLYKNIRNYLEEKSYTRKNLSKDKKKIIEMYGNILLYHDAINNDSILKDKFLDDNNHSRTILKKMRSKIKVLPDILANSIGINILYQNKIASNEASLLPTNTMWSDCLELLNILYEQYNWIESESQGRGAMIKSRKQLKYYAVIMEAWIHAKPLKVIIKKSIDYYHNNGNVRNIYIKENGNLNSVKFDKNNDFHINTLINQVVSDIENVIRYKIKSYVSNYQSLLSSKSNNKVELTDWESYIEYGTTDKTTIEIQNLGFSRNLAIFLKENYASVLITDEVNSISDIDQDKLREIINKDKFKLEYIELSTLLGWEK